MNGSEKLTVFMGKGAQLDVAEALARRVNGVISDKPGEELTLILDQSGVTLSGYGLQYRGDFTEMLPRLTEGRLQHEMLVHIAKTKDGSPRAIDATAGMGEDSILLAACGYDVTMYEQDPVVAALLKDALRRAKKHPILGPIVSKMHLVEGDSIRAMPFENKVDLIYLDPMFPARQKTGLINKKLQLIQKLERPCDNGDALMEAAISAAPKKIIVKRPLKGEYLADRTPDYSVKGKAIRFDCYSKGKQL